jgi:formylglycine-generating enzyme
MQIEPHVGMVWISGGAFRMGSDQHHPEERPIRRVKLDAFCTDSRTVTNAEFAGFVSDDADGEQSICQPQHLRGVRSWRAP